MVSIIPGIDTGAPERTDTSNGLRGSPKRLPDASSRRRKYRTTSSSRPAGKRPLRRNSMQQLQAMVNPGGTGTPRFVISARLAPFPPRTIFMSLVPSARPFPKKYTCFGADDAGVVLRVSCGSSVVGVLINGLSVVLNPPGQQ